MKGCRNSSMVLACSLTPENKTKIKQTTEKKAYSLKKEKTIRCGERPEEVRLRITMEGQLHPTRFLHSGSFLIRARSGESLHFPIVWWGYIMRPCGIHSWNKGSLTQPGQRISGQNSTVVLPYTSIWFRWNKTTLSDVLCKCECAQEDYGKEEAGLRDNMKPGRTSSFWSQSFLGGWDQPWNPPPRSCVFRKETQGEESRDESILALKQ